MQVDRRSPLPRSRRNPNRQLGMGDNGPKRGLTRSSRARLEQLLEDGHRSMRRLIEHQQEYERMLSPDEWQSITNALHAMSTIQHRTFK